MKSNNLYIILLFLLIKGMNLYAQQGNVWAFGYHAGLDFNFTPPKAIATSMKYPNQVDTDFAAGGSASISDCKGHLLFYGTSSTIFNRFNRLMPHGKINGDCGYDRVYIFNVPGDTSKYYYLFRNRGSCNDVTSDTGLYYTIVDMSLDSGRGDVSIAPVRIGNYRDGYAVTAQANGNDYWLVRIISNDSVYVHPITMYGIRNPIKQRISPMKGWNYNTNYIRFDHKGDRLLVCNTVYTWNTYFASQYTFNNKFGTIKKSPTLLYDLSDTIYHNGELFSAEYSPNDSFLYLSNLFYTYLNPNSPIIHMGDGIYQLETYSGNIESNKKQILYQDNGMSNSIISLQLGADNKIYCAALYDSSIGVINYPNKKGSLCNYQAHAIDLTPSWCGLQLPNIYAPVRNLYWLAQAGCQDSVAFINKSDTNYFKSFKWYFGDGDSSMKVNPKHAYAKPGRYYIKLMGENSCGAKMWYNDSITVNLPAHAGLSVDSITYTCLQAHLYAHSTAKDSGQVYLIDYGDSSAVDTGSTYRHTYIKSGTYTLTQCIQRGPCVDTLRKQISISIESLPVAAFSMIDSAGCTPYMASFKNNSKGAAHYLWKYDNGKTDTIQSPLPTFTDTGYHIIKLIVKNHQGCKDSITKTNAIYVAPVPVAAFSYKLRQVCGGIQCTITNTSKYASRFAWDFGDKVADSSISPVHLYPAQGAYRISLKCSNKYCSDTISQVVNIPKPYPRGAGFTHPLTSCIGKAIKFENHSDSSMKCHWDFGDSSTSAVFSPIHSYTKSGTFGIRLIVTNPIGCMDTATIDSITVNPAPKANLSRKDSVKACKSYTYTFENQSKYADSFRWDPGNGIFLIPGDKSGLMQHTYTKAGTYKLRFVAFTKDCTDTETVKLTVKFAPDFPTHILGKVGSSIFCRNSGITFKALGGKSFTYKWDLGDGSTDTALTINHVYTNPGTYSIKLTAYNADSCFFTDSTSVIVLDTFKASILQDINKGCSPKTVSFQAGTVQKDVPLHYVWDFGDKKRDTTASAVHTFKSAAAFTSFRIRLKVSNGYCDDTTSSVVNILNINPQTVTPMRLATVTNNSSIFLSWNSNSAASKYRIYKKGPLDDMFNKLADVIDTFYTDTKVDVNRNAYCYKVQPMDECGNEGTQSTEACPILLSGHILDKDDSRSELDWNTYRSFLFGTSAESVYKDGKLISSPVFSPYTDNNFFSADSGIHRY